MTQNPGAAWPRRFYLYRRSDVSGVSGLGRVADGVCWTDGSASVRWLGLDGSIVYWDNFDSVARIHGHSGATQVLFLDDEEAT